MAFNPEDFQFEKILPPEEVKPIIEWDALHRIMVVRVKRNGSYEYYVAKLDTAVNNNLHTNMPDEWSNDNDRIVSFSIFDDGTYILEKEKLKFDFKTKKSKWTRYEYEDLDDGQVTELFNILKGALEVQKVSEEIVRSKAILDVATRQEYLLSVEEDKATKSKLLMRNSDWTQLPDATEQFAGELAMWNTYRTYLRDNVKGPGDFDDVLDYLIYDEEFKWPIDPLTYHSADNDHTVDYLSVPAHFTNSIEGSGLYATEALIGNIKRAAVLEKNRLDTGIPVAKAIWDKVEQYKLNENIEGADLSNLKLEV